MGHPAMNEISPHMSTGKAATGKLAVPGLHPCCPLPCCDYLMQVRLLSTTLHASMACTDVHSSSRGASKGGTDINYRAGTSCLIRNCVLTWFSKCVICILELQCQDPHVYTMP